MNTSNEVTGWDECLLYDKIMGAAATTNTFYPFDCGIMQPVKILSHLKQRLQNVDAPQLPHDERVNLASSMLQAVSLLSDEETAPQRKVEGLLNVYLLALVASYKMQDRFGFVTPFWSKVPSRMEGAVFGWSLGWHNGEKENVLRSRIVEFCRSYGLELEGHLGKTV